MAIKKTITLQRYGLSVPVADAYCSLQDVQVRQVRKQDGSASWEATAALCCFVSRDAKVAGVEPFLAIPVQHALTSDELNSVFTALYAVVKADPHFVDAVDA